MGKIGELENFRNICISLEMNVKNMIKVRKYGRII